MKNMLIPIIIIFIGILILVYGLSNLNNHTSKEKKSSNIRFGVGGFIGPIPFGFANSPMMLYITIGIAAFLFILWLVLRYTA